MGSVGERGRVEVGGRVKVELKKEERYEGRQEKAVVEHMNKG